MKSNLGRTKAPASLMLCWRLSGVGELPTYKIMSFKEQHRIRTCWPICPVASDREVARFPLLSSQKQSWMPDPVLSAVCRCLRHLTARAALRRRMTGFQVGGSESITSHPCQGFQVGPFPGATEHVHNCRGLGELVRPGPRWPQCAPSAPTVSLAASLRHAVHLYHGHPAAPGTWGDVRSCLQEGDAWADQGPSRYFS